MKVSVWIEDEQDYIEVEVPLYDIAKVIGKYYGVPAGVMKDIIVDFNIDLDEEIDNNDNIKELARELYWRNR